jgi:hypothetical protein
VEAVHILSHRRQRTGKGIRRNRLSLFCLAVAAPLGAQPKVSVRDSAGIQIVTNTIPAKARTWKLAGVPLLRFSSGEGDNPVFTKVDQIRSLPSGGIVFTAKLPEIDGHPLPILLDAKGKLIRKIGRLGRGPGEFGDGSHVIVVLPPDTLLVSDRFRINSVVKLDGILIRRLTFQSEPAGVAMTRPTDRFSDGTLAVQLQQRELPGKPFRANDVLRFDASGKFVNGVVSDLFIGRPMSPMEAKVQAPWRVFGAYGVGGNFVYTFVSDIDEIRVFSSAGLLARVIRSDGKGRKTRSEDIDRYIARAQGKLGDAAKLVDYRKLTYGDRLPIISALLLGPSGEIWAREGVVTEIDPETWRIFDQHGRFTATLTTPPGFAIKEIGDDYVLGAYVGTDEEVEVRMYKLARDKN